MGQVCECLTGIITPFPNSPDNFTHAVLTGFSRLRRELSRSTLHPPVISTTVTALISDAIGTVLTEDIGQGLWIATAEGESVVRPFRQVAR